MKAKDEIARLQGKLDSGDLDPDEPLFCLRAQDRFAAGVVRIWATIAAEAGTPDDKVLEAIALATEADRWPIKQTPGLPETRQNRT